MRSRSSSPGFSLTEILIAMAIFLSLMAGIAVVFAGAVTTVHSAFNTMNGVNLGRTSLAVLEKDLKGAFAARDQGAYYQFYGNAQGFTFVGMVSDDTNEGRIGRVTYVIHPDADARDFETIIVLPWTDVQGRIRDEVAEAGQARGEGDAQILAAQNNAEAAFTSAYPAPPVGQNQFVEFHCIVNTYSLLRYEEPGRNDLDTFDLPTTTLRWPYIDPADPANDNPSACNSTSTGESAEDFLYKELVSGINSRAFNCATDFDMRELASRFGTTIQGQYLYTIRPDTIEQFVSAKKREIWIRMLADDPEVVGPGKLPSFWTTGTRNVGDYVVAEKILHQATLTDPFGARLNVPTDLSNQNNSMISLDALKVAGIFSYANQTGNALPTFNALDNIDGYSTFLFSPSIDTLEQLDVSISKTMIGNTEETATGSPLAPKLPALVVPGYWIMLEKPDPGSADFRRFFSQSIEVPAGVTRTMPANMVPTRDSV